MDVSKRVIELRIKRKYSVSKLAKLADIGQSTLRELERGIKHPTVPTLERICNALNISLSEFFSNIEIDDSFSPEAQELITIIKKLSLHQVNSLISVAEAFLNNK